MKNLKNKNIILVGDSISKGLFDHMSVRRLERNAVDIINEAYGFLIESHSVFGQTLKRAFEKEKSHKYVRFFYAKILVLRFCFCFSRIDDVKVEEKCKK